MASFGIPTFSQNTFKKCMQDLDPIIKDEFEKTVANYIEEEKRNASANNQIDKTGDLWISAIGDCGWQKRSYGCNYSAKSAAGLLIGLHTQKILHLRVRNKYCYSCEVNLTPKKNINAIRNIIS